MPLYIPLDAFPTEQQHEMARLWSDGEGEPLRYLFFSNIQIQGICSFRRTKTTHRG